MGVRIIYCMRGGLKKLRCHGSFCVTIFLEASFLLIKRRSWSIMRQPNQAAIVPMSRMKKGVVKMQPPK